jgi:DNA-binding winged helix-turn-helix (wHTH) protein
MVAGTYARRHANAMRGRGASAKPPVSVEVLCRQDVSVTGGQRVRGRDNVSGAHRSHTFMPLTHQDAYRFGQFELDLASGELRRNAARVRLQPQPFKLLALLVRRGGGLVGRDEIRTELWPDGTFVDFDQSVNFAIKQIREVLGDSAERPLYIETVPRRGYRFIAPLESGVRDYAPASPGTATMRLHKAVWTNIAELRMAEERRRRVTYISLTILFILVGALAVYLLLIRT